MAHADSSFKPCLANELEDISRRPAHGINRAVGICAVGNSDAGSTDAKQRKP